ncbi:hypothetical protein [Pelomonas sp. BJYL3]|uniref:hypothetical protein n=1 Tax=Pelomonas sp. BJYL3 TaxID=2976697 RepID=UPI0022B56561|nr:hypothetical protein [Pelomonas sp. BJYL3]
MTLKINRNLDVPIQGAESSKASESATTGASLSIAVQPKPKVFLVDLDDSVTLALRDSGINATAGSFGTPYRCEISSSYQPWRNSERLPDGYAEQEIIFVDLACEPADGPIGELQCALDSDGYWIGCDKGIIDPRFSAAIVARPRFDRIVAAGGVVVVFAMPESGVSVVTGRKSRQTFHVKEPVQVDEWSFLGALKSVRVSRLSGEEIVVCEQQSLIGRALSAELFSMRYECTLHPIYNHTNWKVLAKNKFGDPVALGYSNDSKGSVFLLPQVDDKASLIKRLLTDVFPELFPHLYPGIDRGRWTHLPEYELRSVIELETARQNAIAMHKAAMAKLDADVSELRSKDGWLHDLLTETGDHLVEAVAAGLAELGFQNVVDMDKIRDRDGKPRREDLQIQDASPTLIVDVKGISNFPGDEDAMQAFKHAALFMREQNRTDVYGLSIVNHQRHLPPLDRDNAMPFRRELVDVALQNQQGLMTTWDLYRLVVNMRRHGWRSNDVKPVLYGHGRIRPIPKHYAFLGRVALVWAHAIGVDIEDGIVRIGDTLAIEFDVYFEEAQVLSLQVNTENRREAMTGDKTGIPWPEATSRPKKGLAVYVCRRSDADTGASSTVEAPPN